LSYQRRAKVLFSDAMLAACTIRGERRQIPPEAAQRIYEAAFPIRPLQGKGKIAESLLTRIARILPCIM
jgi:hypothetical protein